MEENKIGELIERYGEVYVMMEKKVWSMMREKVDKEVRVDEY